MKKFLLLILTFFLWANLSMAVEETTVLEVQGFGRTQQEAVQNGLIEALKQTKGVSIESKKEFINQISESSFSENGSSSYNLDINDYSQGVVREATKGLIQEYRIVDTNPAGDEGWAVKLAVKVVRYKTPGISPNTRRKIAVIPFKTTVPSFIFNGVVTPSNEFIRQFSQKLVNELTQSRKFTVVDREYTDEFIKERNLIASPDAQVSEYAKLGEALGVDYLLIGTITDATIQKTPYTIELTGETGIDTNASFLADYRIVVMATRQIKWSDSVAISLDDSAMEDLLQNLGTDDSQQALFSLAAKQIVNKAMANIYPIKVVKIQGNGEVVLNQGGTTVLSGELFDVFDLGEKVYDPYNGESLGASESWVATIEVVRVIPKMSYARVVKGALASVKNGSICRRATAEEYTASPPPGRTTTVTTSPDGGVRLPFDN